VAAAALSASCIRGTIPARELYRLVPVHRAAGAPAFSGRGGPALTGEIAVLSYETPGVYGDPNIVYRIGEAQYAAYPYREWAIPLSEMLAARTAETLRATPLAAGAVVADAGGERPTQGYVWRGVVREFEEVNRGREAFAAVHLEGTLTRAVDDSVLWRGSSRLERPVAERTMTAVVAALSALADSAVAELARGAGEAVRARAAAVSGQE